MRNISAWAIRNPVIPLVLFLASFVIVFRDREIVSRRFLLRMQTGLTVALVFSFILARWTPTLIAVPLHLMAFFVAALLCHGALYARRPDAAHLTGFYLWMSFGGALGGIFAALVAPHLFATVAGTRSNACSSNGGGGVCAKQVFAGIAKRRSSRKSVFRPSTPNCLSLEIERFWNSAFPLARMASTSRSLTRPAALSASPLCISRLSRSRPGVESAGVSFWVSDTSVYLLR